MYGLMLPEQLTFEGAGRLDTRERMFRALKLLLAEAVRMGRPPPSREGAVDGHYGR